MDTTSRQKKFIAKAQEWGIETETVTMDEDGVYVVTRDHGGYLMLSAYRSPYTNQVRHNAQRLYGYGSAKAVPVALKSINIYLESFRRDHGRRNQP